MDQNIQCCYVWSGWIRIFKVLLSEVRWIRFFKLLCVVGVDHKIQSVVMCGQVDQNIQGVVM